MARKTEVYTWRVSPATKAGLEEAARATSRSVARLLDDIVADHLNATGHAGEAEGDEQRRLHGRAARAMGRIESGLAKRSERTRELVRARLRRRARAR